MMVSVKQPEYVHPGVRDTFGAGAAPDEGGEEEEGVVGEGLVEGEIEEEEEGGGGGGTFRTTGAEEGEGEPLTSCVVAPHPLC